MDAGRGKEEPKTKRKNLGLITFSIDFEIVQIPPVKPRVSALYIFLII